jgi:hypothetical protein
MGFQYNDCYREVCHILLVRKILVNGEKCIKFLGRKNQESAVLYPTPVHFDYGFDRVIWQKLPKANRDRLVKKQSHLQTACSLRPR